MIKLLLIAGGGNTDDAERLAFPERLNHADVTLMKRCQEENSKPTKNKDREEKENPHNST